MTGHTTRHGRSGVGRWLAAVVAAGCTTAVLATGVAAGAGSATVFPSLKPTVPLGVTVTPHPGTLVVAWSPPAYNGEYVNRFGVDVPYVITDYDLRGVLNKSWKTCVDTSGSCTLTHLKVGSTYHIEVRVWNAKGKHSPWTKPVTVTYTG